MSTWPSSRASPGCSTSWRVAAARRVWPCCTPWSGSSAAADAAPLPGDVMAAGRRSRRAGAFGRFASAFANADLRRIQLALAALVVGGSGYQVGLAVVAFRLGGTGAVGLAFFAQVFPVALVAPFASVLADRFPRRRVMVAIDVLRCGCTAAVAVAVAADGSLALVLLLGAPGALASGIYAPASRALLPSLVAEPEELTAANAVMSGVEHSALLVGPALFGALLIVAGPGLVFAICSAFFLVSGLLVARIRAAGERPPSRE